MRRPLDEFLAEALGTPAGPERDAWIARVCGSDAPLRCELLGLIAAAESAPASFLSPVLEPGTARRPEDAQ